MTIHGGCISASNAKYVAQLFTPHTPNDEYSMTTNWKNGIDRVARTEKDISEDSTDLKEGESTNVTVIMIYRICTWLQSSLALSLNLKANGGCVPRFKWWPVSV